MATEAQTIWRHGRIYGLGSILNRFASLLLIPVLLHTLTVEEWGVYALILLLGRLITIVPSAINDTMAPTFFDRDEDRDRHAVIATTLALYVFTAVTFLVLAYPGAIVLGDVLFQGQTYFLPLLLAITALVFEVLFEIELDYLRIRGRSGIFMAASLLRSLLHFGLSIFFVVVLTMGVTGVVLGQLISFALLAVPTAIFVLREVGLGASRKIAGDMIRVGLPLVPAWFAKASLELLERYLLSILASTATMGLYALASKLVDQLRPVLTMPFAVIWGVRLLEIGKMPERAAEFNRVFVYFMCILSTAALGLALFAPELIHLLSAEAFWGADIVVPILAIGYVTRVCYYHFEIGIIQSKRTAYLMWANWATLFVSALALYILIPAYGLIGAAAGEVISRSFRLAVTVWAAARCSNLVKLFPWGSLTVMMIWLIVCYLPAAWVTGNVVSVTNFAIKCAVMTIFVVLGFYSPILHASERRQVYRALAEQLGQLRARLAR